MTFWAESFDGTRLLLGRAVSASLTYEKEVPADLLKVEFPSLGDWPELLKVYGYKDSKVVFTGIVDEQNTRWSKDGVFTELVCRSLAAVLIDNEAEPVTLRNPSWRLMCEKYARPFGIEHNKNDIKCEVATGEFAVKKGESCYSVLANFAKIFMGKEIFVCNKGILHISKNKCNQVDLGEVVNLKKKFCPYKKISQVFIQNSTGAYQTGFVNNETNGVCRRRYFASSDVRSPAEFVKNQERKAYIWQAECDKFVFVKPKEYCNFNSPEIENVFGLEVSKVQQKLDKFGWTTIITMLGKGEMQHVADKEVK